MKLEVTPLISSKNKFLLTESLVIIGSMYSRGQGAEVFAPCGSAEGRCFHCWDFLRDIV